jgi:hypothetical protein
MLFIDKILARGVRFVLEKVATVVDREMNDPDRLRERLLEAEMRRDAGEISEEEFAAVEGDVLARLREFRSDVETGATLSSGEILDVEVEADSGEARESAPPARRKASGKKKRAPRRGRRSK